MENIEQNPDTNYSESNIVNNENVMQEEIGSIKENVEMEIQMNDFDNDLKEPLVKEKNESFVNENEPEGR